MRAIEGKGTRTMPQLTRALLLVAWSLSGTYSQEGCDQNLVLTTRGSIQSPGFLNGSLTEQTCTYTFSLWNGDVNNWNYDHYVYKLTFTEFNLSTGPDGSCGGDYVEVHEMNATLQEYYSLSVCTSGQHVLLEDHSSHCKCTTASVSVRVDNMSCSKNARSNTEKCHPKKARIRATDKNINISQYFTTVRRLCGNIMPPIFQRVVKVYFVSSQSTSLGYGFRADFARTVICGEDMTGKGSYLNTYIYNAYQVEYNCTWTITVDAGKHVWLIMRYFYQYSYIDDCQSKYIKIYDGLNKNDSKLLFVFCNSYYYGTMQIHSSSESLLIELYSNGSVQYTYGWGAYIADDGRQDCGPEQLTDNTGVFGLPSYYQGYWKNGVCTWNISAAEGSVIQVAFAQLYLSRIDSYVSNQCNVTTLNVYDGVQITEKKLLYSWCGYSSQLITSITNNLIIQLIINDTSGYAQASIAALYETVAAIDVRRDCGGLFTGEAGTFSSPNYPSNYTPLTECTWNISVDPDFAIQLNIFNISIESSGNCMYDSLQVYDGVNASSPRLTGGVCGNGYWYWYYSYAYTVRSTANNMFIQFTTNKAVQDSGFTANWTRICEKFISNERGMLQSPYFPRNYPGSLNCKYMFYLYEPGYHIDFHFNAFQLQNASSNGSCVHDYIEIKDVPNWQTVDQRLPKRFCGKSIPENVTTYFTTTVQFVSDDSIEGTGFQLSYVKESKAVCGKGWNTGPTGLISSPGFPGSYPHTINCTWTIQVEPKKTINLVFESMNMGSVWWGPEEGNRCIVEYNNGAYLQIFDGNTTENNTLVGTYCGSVAPLPYMSTSSTLTLQFKSTYNYNMWTGFSASYTAMDNFTNYNDCGGKLTGSGGEIMSPNYPGIYPNHSVCVWTIQGATGFPLRISFADFNMEDSNSCQQDALELRDGINALDRRLDRLCGHVIPLDVTSTGSAMYVKFVSDGVNSYAGFKAKWISVCEERRRWSGTFQSPSFPESFNGSLECRYFVEQWEGYIVQLTFNVFHLSNDSNNCDKNYVEVRDGGFDGAPLLGKRYCGDTLPPTILSTHSQMLVHFVTDGSTSNTGFQASFTYAIPSCGTKNLTEKQGTFTSPSYPDNYPNEVTCKWNIITDPNRVIQLTFDTFTLEGPSAYCWWDWVQIFNDNSNTNEKKYCGVSRPDTITSNGNTLSVEFHSDWFVSYPGFSASYITYDPASDELTRQYDLYPFGLENGDDVLEKKDTKTAKVHIKTGIPVGKSLQYYAFIGNKGLVSFDDDDTGKGLKLKKDRMTIYPYHSDIGVDNTKGTKRGVFYQLHTDNETILNKASAEVQEFADLKEYKASLVLVVTWYRISHLKSRKPLDEEATVQLAVISNGHRSFALVYYRTGAMKWTIMSGENLVIGISTGVTSMESVYSNAPEAFTTIDKIKGNTGRRGMWLYELGESYSADQVCYDWYKRNKPLNVQRQKDFKRLPQCPCSWWFLWGNWRWAYWRDNYKVQCYRMTLGGSRSVVPYGKECCYKWDWTEWWWWWWTSGQYVSDGPHAGSATAYNPTFWSLSGEYQQEDMDPHDVCCYNTTSAEYCDMYHELRPVGECTSRIPFRFSFTFGDPHIKTLDGFEYTFNGWGEYVMVTIKTSDVNFTLQGRTGLAETESGTVTNATVFKAFGAEENGVRTFVELDPNSNDTMIIFADGVDYTTQFKQKGTDFLEEKDHFTLKRNNDSGLVIIFTSEIQLTLSIGFKSLEFSISMPTKFENLTRGLLGNFNGNKNDDFVLPNGQILNSNITDRQIFEIFGPAWNVTEANSVMRYGLREEPRDYSHPEFLPIFLDEQSPADRQAAQNLCGATNLACIYDYIATGSAGIASATKSSASTASETEKISKNTVPQLNFDPIVSVISGEPISFSLQGYDPDTDDTLSYFAVDDANGMVQVNKQTGMVNLTVFSSRPVSLSFYATDSSNITSPVRDITLIVCSGCSGHGNCNFSHSITSNLTRSFQTAVCVCLPAWTGPDCSEDYNACLGNPCSAQQTCTDLTPQQQGLNTTGFKCSSCPKGYTMDVTDPTRCIDVDECANFLTNNCSMLCNNLPGSYACLCNTTGYRLAADGISCDDVNECAEHTDNCQQLCVNTEGSYECRCQSGYTLSGSKGACVADSITTELCNTTGCAQGCSVVTDINNTTVPTCFCLAGYEVDPTNRTNCRDRDECTDDTICSESCMNTVGSFACTCYAGHMLAADDRTCTPCPSLRYGPDCSLTCDCSGRGISCHPVTGCVCQEGWKGTHCQTDVDECSDNPGVCPDRQICSNTNGSFVCNCPSGYVKDTSGRCVDLDECTPGSTANTCSSQELCINIPGGFYCTCKRGFKREHNNCTDIDECGSGSSVCQQQCINMVGSYNCECYYGFRLNADRTACTQVRQVCSEAEASYCDHGCTLNDQDSTVCFCNTGYKLATDQHTCQDIDECRDGTTGCSHSCSNINGGFMCSCPVGMMLDNDKKTCLDCPAGMYGENCTYTCGCGIGSDHCDIKIGCVCKDGWTGVKCDRDVNECEDPTVVQKCQNKFAVCQNLQGGYRCQCSARYQQNSFGICEDINECNTSTCDQLCENSDGSYRCLCKRGFTLNATSGLCNDIDECEPPGTHSCTQHCDNTPGSYRCSCSMKGYTLDNDGVTCRATTNCNRTDCPTQNGGCSEEKCFCNSGFNLTLENTCTYIDVDWCALNKCQHFCNETVDGKSFICSCKNGFLLNDDKKTCRECETGKYGLRCSQSCSCQAPGTISCNNVNGACLCKSGWGGAKCDVDIDECLGNPSTACPEHAQCHNTNGSYLCSCQPGYSKANGSCEVCEAGTYGSQCAEACTCNKQNTVSCNTVNGSCLCKAGWSGTKCDMDINECLATLSVSCPAHAQCKNTAGSYQCLCQPGYNKTADGLCQVCSANFYGENCANICSCNNSVTPCDSTTGACICNAGWEGARCDSDVDECASLKHNCTGPHAVCVNLLGSFLCQCEKQYFWNSAGYCSEQKRVSLVVKVDIANLPDDINNETSVSYAKYKRLAKQALFDKLKADVPDLQEVNITKISKGSLIIEFEAIVNSNTQVMSTLVVAIISLNRGTMTIGNDTGSVVVTITGTTVDMSSPCQVLRAVSPCPSDQTCQETDGKPECRSADSKKDNLAVIVGSTLGSCLVVLLVVIIIIIIYKKKHPKIKTGGVGPVHTSFPGGEYTKTNTTHGHLAHGIYPHSAESDTEKRNSWTSGM